MSFLNLKKECVCLILKAVAFFWGINFLEEGFIK